MPASDNAHDTDDDFVPAASIIRRRAPKASGAAAAVDGALRKPPVAKRKKSGKAVATAAVAEASKRLPETAGPPAKPAKVTSVTASVATKTTTTCPVCCKEISVTDGDDDERVLERHVNACLDAQRGEPPPSATANIVSPTLTTNCARRTVSAPNPVTSVARTRSPAVIERIAICALCGDDLTACTVAERHLHLDACRAVTPSTIREEPETTGMDVDNMKSATACGTSETTVPALHPPVDEDLFKPPALPTRAKPKKEKAPLKKPKKPKAPTKKERAEQALREAQAAAQARSVLSHATLRANETRRKKKRDATSTLVADVDEAKRHACVRLAELLESSDEGESAVGVDGDGQSGDDTVDLGSRHTIRLTPPFLSASNLRYNRDSFWCVSQSAIEEQQGLHGHNYQTSLLYNVTSKAEHSMREMAEHVEQKLAEHNSTASLPKTRRTLLLERSVQVMEEMHALCREYHSFVEELFPEVPLSASGDAATVSAASLLAPGREKATVSSANGFAAVIDDDAESVIISEVEEDDYDSNGLAPFISHAQAPPTLVPASPRQSNVGKSDIVLTDTISITPIPVELESSDEDRHGVAFADRTIPFMDNADDDDYLADVDHGGAVITMQSFESSASRTVDDVSEEVLKSTHTPALKQSQATSGKRKSPEETRDAVIDYLRSCEATYNRIVLYEGLDIVALQQEIKDATGIAVARKTLAEILDATKSVAFSSTQDTNTTSVSQRGKKRQTTLRPALDLASDDS